MHEEAGLGGHSELLPCMDRILVPHTLVVKMWERRERIAISSLTDLAATRACTKPCISRIIIDSWAKNTLLTPKLGLYASYRESCERGDRLWWSEAHCISYGDQESSRLGELKPIQAIPRLR